MSGREKYTVTIHDQELRGVGKDHRRERYIASIVVRPPLAVYDNQDLQDMLLGPNQEGVHAAPVIATDEGTYFRAHSDRKDGYKDLEAIRVRIEEFANHPGSAILNLPPSDYFTYE
jgi:hypothetical protein